MRKMRTLVVTVPHMIGADDLEPLKSRSHVTYVERTHVDEVELASLCEGYDYLMLNYDVIKNLSTEFYTQPAIRSLKAIATDITGMSWASPQAAADIGLPLMNIPNYSTESVAESILSEILLHSRQRHKAYMDEIQGRPAEARSGINLVGRTAAVVGLGSIGLRVANLLNCLGMRVITWNRTPRDEYPQESLETIFETSEVICICLKTVKQGPHKNVGIINADLLGRCRDAILINLANAALVDNVAVAREISAGRISGYTVERVPEVLGSVLANFDAVHLPPKNAWASEESLLALRQAWVGNVISALNGKFTNVYSD